MSDDLDTIAIDVIQRRLAKNDAISVKIGDDAPCLLQSLQVGRAAPGRVSKPQVHLKGRVSSTNCAIFKYFAPGGVFSFAVPMVLVPYAVSIDQVGKGIFMVLINTNIRRTPKPPTAVNRMPPRKGR